MGASYAGRTAGAVGGLLVAYLTLGCGGGSASPCGAGYVTEVYWSDPGNGAGWYDSGTPGYGYGGGWYDPGDTYDSSVDNGGGTGNGGSNDGSGDNSGDTSDTSGGNGSDGDGSGGDSTNSVPRLRLASASRVQSGDGCWTCVVGCTAGLGAQATGRQAVGGSDASYDDACRAAVQSLEGWAHDSLRQRLQSCQRIDRTAGSRAPASPSVNPASALRSRRLGEVPIVER